MKISDGARQQTAKYYAALFRFIIKSHERLVRAAKYSPWFPADQASTWTYTEITRLDTRKVSSNKWTRLQEERCGLHYNFQYKLVITAAKMAIISQYWLHIIQFINHPARWACYELSLGTHVQPRHNPGATKVTLI